MFGKLPIRAQVAIVLLSIAAVVYLVWAYPSDGLAVAAEALQASGLTGAVVERPARGAGCAEDEGGFRFRATRNGVPVSGIVCVNYVHDHASIRFYANGDYGTTP